MQLMVILNLLADARSRSAKTRAAARSSTSNTWSSDYAATFKRADAGGDRAQTYWSRAAWADEEEFKRPLGET